MLRKLIYDIICDYRVDDPLIAANRGLYKNRLVN